MSQSWCYVIFFLNLAKFPKNSTKAFSVFVSILKMRPHYATRQNATPCSFATRQMLLGICRQCDRIHMKKEFFADVLQVTKTVKRDRWTLSDFFLKLVDTIWKPLTHHMPHGFLWWDRQFADRIFRPRSIEWHAVAEPTQRPHILEAWHDFCCAALPLCATWHSVEVR